jgi:pyrimidine operon attenuation protein / uracil phosphoribosyltransferase
MTNRLLLDNTLLQITLERLCYQLIENYGDFSGTAIIGVQPRGVFLADRIHQRLEELLGHQVIYRCLDATFYRDDFRRKDKQLQAKQTDIDFTIDDMRIVLVDDVLYTGRTIRAALDALMAFGRPKHVELLTLINRRFNRELPIQPDYVGKTVDTIEDMEVKVQWLDEGSEDCVILEKQHP